MYLRPLFVTTDGIKSRWLRQSGTLAPFLYQTHTLSRRLSRSFRTNRVSVDSDGGSSHKNTQHLARLPRTPADTSFYPKDRSSDCDGGADHAIPFAHDGAESRLEPHTWPHHRAASSYSSHPNHTLDGDYDMDHSGQSRDNVDPSMEPRRRDSTITTKERDAFARIFDDIMHPPKDRLQDTIPFESQPGESKPASEKKGTGTLDSILNATACTMRPREDRRLGDSQSFAPVSSRSSTVNSDAATDSEALARYPESLRAAAAKATTEHRLKVAEERGQAPDERANEAQHDKANDPAELQRMSQLQRMETLLREAPTDQALWAVLEREVFSMISELQTKPATKRQRKPRQTPTALADPSTAPLQPPSVELVSRLAVVGSNYPQLLLVAMRLLAHEFRAPAACGALFARVKALGPVSYVLGASTALYNEMLELMWRAYRDFDAVADLLDEMDKSGVDFDLDTDLALQDIVAERERVASGERGRVMEAVWEMEAVQGGWAKMVRWRELVRERLAERRSLEAA